MPEIPSQPGLILGGLALLSALAYIGYQLNEVRRQRRADAMLNRINLRARILRDQIESDALHSAGDKFFEYELYKGDQGFFEIEELSLRERRALIKSLELELLYFQLLYYQRRHNIIDGDECSPLNYIMAMYPAPHRCHWKDTLRLIDHYPHDFIAHVDGIVKRFDEVERRMDSDQDAHFEAVFLEVFDVPAPPDWLQAVHTGATRTPGAVG